MASQIANRLLCGPRGWTPTLPPLRPVSIVMFDRVDAQSIVDQNLAEGQVLAL